MKKPKKSSQPKSVSVPSKVSRGLQMAGREAIPIDDETDVTSILKFLENFQAMVNPIHQNKSKLISIKIPEPLLLAFKFKAEKAGVPYQTMIKKLMMAWLNG